MVEKELEPFSLFFRHIVDEHFRDKCDEVITAQTPLLCPFPNCKYVGETMQELTQHFCSLQHPTVFPKIMVILAFDIIYLM
jgi:hypothetical protein